MKGLMTWFPPIIIAATIILFTVIIIASPTTSEPTSEPTIKPITTTLPEFHDYMAQRRLAADPERYRQERRERQELLNILHKELQQAKRDCPRFLDAPIGFKKCAEVEILAEKIAELEQAQ